MGQIKGGTLLACRLTNAGVQNIPNASETPVTFDTETYDFGGLHDTATNPSRITIPAGTPAKYYSVIGMIKYAGNTTGVRGFYLKKNNTNYIVDQGATPNNAGDWTMHINDVISLVGGDYIELRTYQASGSTLGIHGDAQSSGSCRFVLREVV